MPSVTVDGRAHLSHACELRSELYAGARPEESLVQQKGEDYKTVRKEAGTVVLSCMVSTGPGGGQTGDISVTRLHFFCFVKFFFPV